MALGRTDFRLLPQLILISCNQECPPQQQQHGYDAIEINHIVIGTDLSFAGYHLI